MDMHPKLERISWIAGIFAAIAALAGLLFTLPSENKHSLTSFSQQAGSSGTQIGSVNGAVIINPQTSRDLSNPEHLDIEGKWDTQRSLHLINLELGRKKWNSVEKFCDDEEPCDPIHTILGEYNLLYRNRESIVVPVSSINAGNFCHACSAYLSFFEFERGAHGWKLVNSDIAAFAWGSWGKIDPNEIKVYVLGDNLYGVVLEGDYTAQGHTSWFTSIYARVGDSLREILSIQTGEDDSGARQEPDEDWHSDIKIQPGTTGFYDLLIEHKGVHEGKAFQESELLKFNGQKYIQSKVYR